MKNTEHINPNIEGCAERVSVKSELLSIVKQYTKLIDRIESSHIANPTTNTDEESPSCRKRIDRFINQYKL